MTQDELYEFDLNGFIIYRGFLGPQQVAEFRAALGEVREAPVSGKFSFLGRHPCFMDLLADPRALLILRALIGPWLRFDHAFGIQMTRTTPVDDNLHGGHGQDQGAFFYDVKNGRIRNGQVAVMYALSDVASGDGGFVCVPGSHKASLDHRPALDSHLVVNPALRAGDLLVFTEALIHGSKRWTAAHARQVLFYLYVPGYMSYRSVDTIAPFAALARTDIQRHLFRPPDVNSYREETIDPGAEWPASNYRPVTRVPGEALSLRARLRDRLDALRQAGHAEAYRLRRFLVRRGLL